MLNSVHLFSQMPADRLAQLEKMAISRRYPKNSILFIEGEESGSLYVIKSGLICAYIESDDGRQLVLNYIGPGEYFGELSLLDRQPRSTSARVVNASELLVISRESFRGFLNENWDMYEILLTELASRIRNLTSNVKDLALLDVYGRVVRTLERYAPENSPKLTHQTIAEMVGASREMVSRIMKELIVGGYVEVNQRQIRILRELPKNW